MSKILVAMLAVSVSVLAIACGGAEQKPAEAAPPAETPAAPAAPEAAPPAAPEAAPPAGEAPPPSN